MRLYNSEYQQLKYQIMSYFQKYQRTPHPPTNPRHPSELPIEQTPDSQSRKNSESRQSYLKAFKKYYIDKLIHQKTKPLQPAPPIDNKQNCYFHENPPETQLSSINTHNKSTRSTNLSKQSVLRLRNDQNLECPKINRSKIVSLVSNNENQLQELLYSSISQVEREMMNAGSSTDLFRQNKMLRGSIHKLKSILKQKLEVALKKNKQELTLMFDDYSTMIKKLLTDKETLTTQLEAAKQQCQREQEEREDMQAEHDNRVRIIMDENNAQIGNTKQQIEEFLDMIIQYEEEASSQKEELEKLREKVIDLEMENDRLQKEVGEGAPSYSLTELLNTKERDIQLYGDKIDNLLNIVDKLQEDNLELNQFLKSCKCSKIKKNCYSEESIDDPEQVVDKYERRLLNAEKEFIREEMVLRQGMHRKDQCIDRLNLVISEMKKCRYESVDRLTEQALSRQIVR